MSIAATLRCRTEFRSRHPPPAFALRRGQRGPQCRSGAELSDAELSAKAGPAADAIKQALRRDCPVRRPRPPSSNAHSQRATLWPPNSRLSACPCSRLETWAKLVSIPPPLGRMLLIIDSNGVPGFAVKFKCCRRSGDSTGHRASPQRGHGRERPRGEARRTPKGLLGGVSPASGVAVRPSCGSGQFAQFELTLP
jgi:hypothetical protein